MAELKNILLAFIAGACVALLGATNTTSQTSSINSISTRMSEVILDNTPSDMATSYPTPFILETSRTIADSKGLDSIYIISSSSASVSSYTLSITDLLSRSTKATMQTSSQFVSSSQITSVMHNRTSSHYSITVISVSKRNEASLLAQRTTTFSHFATSDFSNKIIETQPIYGTSRTSGSFTSKTIFPTSSAVSKSRSSSPSLSLLSSLSSSLSLSFSLPRSASPSSSVLSSVSLPLLPSPKATKPYSSAITGSVSLKATRENASRSPSNRGSSVSSLFQNKTTLYLIAQTQSYSTMRLAPSHSTLSSTAHSSNITATNFPISSFVYSKGTPAHSKNTKLFSSLLVTTSEYSEYSSVITPRASAIASLSSTYLNNLSMSTSSSLSKITTSTTTSTTSSRSRPPFLKTDVSSVVLPRSSSIYIPGNGGENKDNRLSERTIIIISTCSAAGAIIFIIILSCVMLSRKKKKRKNTSTRRLKDQEMRNIPEESKIDWKLKWSTMKAKNIFAQQSETFGGLYGDTNNAFLSEIGEEQHNDSNIILDLSSNGDMSFNEKDKNGNKAEIPRCRTFSDSGMLRSDSSDHSLIDVIKKNKENKKNHNENTTNEFPNEEPDHLENVNQNSFSSFKTDRSTSISKKNDLTLFDTPGPTGNINGNDIEVNVYQKKSPDRDLGIDNEVFDASDHAQMEA